MTINLEYISVTSDYFETVVALGDQNNETLGFLPKGAFQEHAIKRHIIGAIKDGTLIGYLLFRESRGEIAIVHLCISDCARGQRVAQLLFERLKQDTSNYRGIGLLCRTDYDVANRVWKRLGLFPISEKPGRSQHGSVLKKWWFEHPQNCLWSISPSKSNRIVACMDSSVFFALFEPADNLYNEAATLKADWLADELDLYVTDEIFLEIDRGSDHKRRRIAQERASGFRLPPRATPSNHEKIFDELCDMFPDKSFGNDQSDLKHLAHAIANEADVLLTWDAVLLEIAEEVSARWNIDIERPIDLITEIDTVKRKQEYQPSLIFGNSEIIIQRPHSTEEHDLIAAFLAYDEGETKGELREKLHSVFRTPLEYEIVQVKNAGGSPLALIATHVTTDKREVTILRSKKDALQNTLVRFSLMKVLNDAMKGGQHLISISEHRQSYVIANAAEEIGFVKTSTSFTKFVGSKTGRSNEVIQSIESRFAEDPDLSEISKRIKADVVLALNNADQVALSAFEHLIWPSKFTDSCIPSFLVAIKPYWAQNLFDSRIAEKDLFGANTKVALNCENVYYRSALNNGGLSSPGRILWYVTADPKNGEEGRISACSRLCEVVIGRPKELFKRFKRLGIYEWKNISDLVDGDTSKNIMALRFDDTELLSTPVPLNKIRECFNAENRRFNPQSPVQLNNSLFFNLYSLGKNFKP